MSGVSPMPHLSVAGATGEERCYEGKIGQVREALLRTFWVRKRRPCACRARARARKEGLGLEVRERVRLRLGPGGEEHAMVEFLLP